MQGPWFGNLNIVFPASLARDTDGVESRFFLSRMSPAIGSRKSSEPEAERLMMDRHDEMSASFIGHLHGLFRSAVRMDPGIVSADRRDRQIDGTGSAQLRK